MSMRAAMGSAAAAAAAATLVAQSLTVSFTDALTYYDLGEHETVARALATSIGADPARVIPMLARDAEAWIAAAAPAEAPRRRRAAAAFALELGWAGLDTQFEVSREATEWACQLLRRAGPPTGFERRWHVAALALLAGSFEHPDASQPALPPHIGHVAARFPGEPRLALARALLDERRFWIERTQFTPEFVAIGERGLAGRAVEALAPAAAHAETRAEARLRLGFFEHRRGDGKAALEHLAAAALGDDDGSRVYLAHLFAGWTHERAGRMDEAIAAFRRALEAVNGLSAALGLAVRLYAEDRRDEADQVVRAALAAALPDPWKSFGYGEYRRMPQLMAELRAELQR
jgi:hypothetical protein